MTELLEPISIGFITEESISCPFEHDLEDPPNVENKLVGQGGTLSRYMSNQTPTGTYLYPQLKNQYKLTKADRKPNPRKEGDLKKPKKPVKVIFYDASAIPGAPPLERKVDYPLSVAAHHCIPAQESLKRCPKLLRYMVKKGTSAGLKTGGGESDFSGGVVWANVGYEINGLQNGIFLPGNYAVGGGRGGLKVWKPMENDDDEGPEDAEDGTDDMLRGQPVNLSEPSNTCWQYVKGAIDTGKGQFHDRHQDYSDLVVKLLNAIADDYNRFRKKALNSECPDCKKRLEHFTTDGKGIPTDHELVTKLNKLSRKLMAYVNATGWNSQVYTSKWMKAYMDEMVFDGD